MKPLRHTEIDDERRAGTVDQDIGRLQVTVQYSRGACGMMDRTGDRRDHSVRRALGPRRTRLGMFEVCSLDQLHREIIAAIVFAHLVDGDDVGMIELGGRLRFVVKPFDVSSLASRPPESS